jgi:hypothetical protein
MKRLFAVTRLRGPCWDHSRPVEGQEDWDSHAAFMDALQAEGLSYWEDRWRERRTSC